MPRTPVFLVILVVVTLGCGHNASPSTSPLNICTGRERLELSAVSLPLPARAPPGMQVMWENGHSFVYVDGSCRYWALTPQDVWAEVRTGQLTADAERSLLARVRYESWHSWVGEHHPSSIANDADIVILVPGMRAESTVTCFEGCGSAPVPSELQATARDLGQIATDLWMTGNPVTGDVRFVLVREETSEVPIQYLEWPLAIEPSTLSISESEAAQLSWGRGQIASNQDADSLRALRAGFRDSPLVGLVPHIPVKDSNGFRYKLFLRDTIPYEDETGLIRPN